MFCGYFAKMEACLAAATADGLLACANGGETTSPARTDRRKKG